MADCPSTRIARHYCIWFIKGILYETLVYTSQLITSVRKCFEAGSKMYRNPFITSLASETVISMLTQINFSRKLDLKKFECSQATWLQECRSGYQEWLSVVQALLDPFFYCTLKYRHCIDRTAKKMVCSLLDTQKKPNEISIRQRKIKKLYIRRYRSGCYFSEI
jgi:hypothetical protein